MGITQVYLEQVGILIMYLHSQAINLHKPQIQFIILVLVFFKKNHSNILWQTERKIGYRETLRSSRFILLNIPIFLNTKANNLISLTY